MATSTVSDDTFESDVLKSSTPVVVDFWAEWCGPCRQIAPALEEIAKELGGKVKIVKINIDENQRTPSRYNVRAIRTLMIFKDGQLAATQTGALPEEQACRLDQRQYRRHRLAASTKQVVVMPGHDGERLGSVLAAVQLEHVAGEIERTADQHAPGKA